MNASRGVPPGWDDVKASDSFGVEKTAAPRIPAPNVVDLADPFEPLARAAYEAYSASTGGRSAVSGAELPSWYGLLEQETGPAVRAGWRAAAKAVALIATYTPPIVEDAKAGVAMVDSDVSTDVYALPRDLLSAFTEWCAETGEHHGTPWEPLFEILNNPPAREVDPLRVVGLGQARVLVATQYEQIDALLPDEDEGGTCECGHVADEHEVRHSTGQPDECTVCGSADAPDSVCGGFDPAR